MLGSAGGSPTALSRRVLPDTQKSHSAPTSLRGSPKATPWAPPARQTHLVLPDLQLRGCNSMPTTPKRVRGPSREYAPGSSITRLGPDHGGESTSEPSSFRSHPPVFQRLPGARWEAPALGRRSPSEGGAATTATTAATSPVVNGEGDSTTFFMPNPPPTIGRPVESDLRLAPPAPRLRGVQRAQLRPSGEIPPIDDAKVQVWSGPLFARASPRTIAPHHRPAPSPRTIAQHYRPAPSSRPLAPLHTRSCSRTIAHLTRPRARTHVRHGNELWARSYLRDALRCCKGCMSRHTRLPHPHPTGADGAAAAGSRFWVRWCPEGAVGMRAR